MFRSIASQYQDLRSVHSLATMNVISHLIEDQILNHKLTVDLYAGFQRFSDFSEQLPRYMRLGDLCRRVFVFGVADIQPPSIPGIEFIELSPTSALGRERFLLVNTSDFWAALLAQEIEGSKTNTGAKPFDGVWFFDEQVIERVSLLISQVMGTFYQPILTRNYATQSAHIAELNRRMLGQLEEAELSSHRRSMQLSTLHQFSAVLLQYQPLPCILRDAVQILSMIFGATDAVIALNLQGDQFMLVSATGNVSTGKPMSCLGQGASGQAFTQGKVIAIADVQSSGQIEPLMPTAKTLLAGPIKGRRRIHGVVTVGGSEPNQWNKEDGQTVIAIASMLAVIIEQKAQISGDVVLQLRRARHLEQTIGKLRKPMTRLLSLHTKLMDEVHLLPVQRELMAQVENLYSELADNLGVPRTVKKALDSKVPPLAKPPLEFGGKLPAPEAEIDAMISPRRGNETGYRLGAGEI